jgi:hypothetical protein
MKTSTFKLVSGVGAAEVVHVEAADPKALAAAVTAEHLAMLNAGPVMNHSCRVVLPQGRELRGQRAKRWLAENA